MPKRLVLTTLGLAAAATLAMPAGSAQAASGPSLGDAKKQLAHLNDQVDALSNKYNKAVENWKAAKRKLAVMSKSVQAERKTFDALHVRVAQLAAAAYKNGGDADSLPDLVSAKDPQAVLGQMSAFTALTNNRATELSQFLASAQRLEREKALAQQTAEQLKGMKADLDKQQSAAHAAIRKQLRLIAKLGGNIDPGSSRANCSILGFGRAETVLKFACAQLGKPYVFGGAGPSTWDCSGLTMMAYKQVGINMHHYVPDQHAMSKPVSRAELQPGDLVFFNGDNHMGMYVGNGKFIQAPHTGDVVKISSLSDPYYSSVWNGGGRLL
jgi:peptidoglycan DL-endopeptidase CwlO